MSSWRSNSGRGATEDMLDRENQARVEGLSSKVGILNQLAFDINAEADSQNKYIGGMGTDFEAGQGLLSGSMNRFSGMVSSGKNNRKLMCYLILGLVVIFLILYFALSKWRS